MVPGGSGLFRVVLGCSGWFWVVPGGYGLFLVVSPGMKELGTGTH